MSSELQPDHLLQRLLARGPARLLKGAAGPCYRTGTQLALRVDHAAAIDAVQRELDLEADLGPLVQRYGLFEARSQARDRAEYLLRPDLGRRLDEASAERLRQRCPAAPGLQIVVGDGLSATAVATQVPVLLPLLMEKAKARGWDLGQPRCEIGFDDGGWFCSGHPLVCRCHLVGFESATQGDTARSCDTGKCEHCARRRALCALRIRTCSHAHSQAPDAGAQNQRAHVRW